MNLDYQLDGPEGAPVIVLSNSLGTTRAMWQPQMAALTQRFRVLRYDTHGHGKTQKSGKVTLAQLGEDVIALLDHLNIAKAWFCGISMGGPDRAMAGAFCRGSFLRYRGGQHGGADWRSGQLAFPFACRAPGGNGRGGRRCGGPLVHARLPSEGAGGG